MKTVFKLRPLITAVFVTALASAAHAGDQGDPEQSCDGNTFQMVECLKAKTARWDKRMNVAYQQAGAEGCRRRQAARTAPHRATAVDPVP
ncbi:lysozyme inhibitor LprI family protein [Bradyrhizobium septentrionale]|uniref:lysozyme inhibitor LprI family protein n=1 Tax=Bradyrhizobium septentrionale TaxID=1404411 RepID=UPI0030D2CCC7